jgi:phosphoglycolate phosphatase
MVSDGFCFIFDLDGTLLDDVFVFKDIFTKNLPQHFGKVISPDLEKELTIKSLSMISGKSSRTMILKVMWKMGGMIGLNLIQKFQMIQYLLNEYHRLIPNVPFFPGVLDTLQQIKKEHKIALNTSSSRKELHDRFQNRMDLLDLFEGNIITRSDVKQLKPHPEGIIKIAQKLQIKPEMCIMVGDMNVDIDAGKNAGAKTIAVLCGFLTKAHIQESKLNPDFIFQNVPEIIQHLPQILSNF